MPLHWPAVQPAVQPVFGLTFSFRSGTREEADCVELATPFRVSPISAGHAKKSVECEKMWAHRGCDCCCFVSLPVALANGESWMEVDSGRVVSYMSLGAMRFARKKPWSNSRLFAFISHHHTFAVTHRRRASNGRSKIQFYLPPSISGGAN